jgi:phage protein D
MAPVASTVDRPELELRVAGRRVEPRLAADVVEVDVTEEVYRHARCSLLVQNWKADSREVRWSDDGPLVPGAEIDLLLGYGSTLTSVFSGVVTALTAHFSQEQAPMLQVEARSRSILLDGPVRSRIFENTSDGDLVSALAADVGLDADADAGITRPAVLIERENGWAHLVERARSLGWVAYVREKRLVIRPPAPPDNPLQLAWTKDLVELRLTQDVGTLPKGSTAAAWDSENHAQASASAQSPTGGLPTGDRRDHQAAVGDTGWTLRDEVASSAAARPSGELDDRSDGQARHAELRHLSGFGRTVGLPSLRCDTWMSFSGGGRRFSGPYYVSTVRHRLGRSGFSTEFGVGLAAPLTPPPARSGGGAHARLLIGVVTDLSDPENHARVKVSFPWSGGTDAVWARLLTPYAGDKQGFFFIPDPGQEVLVGFVDGSEDDPVVLGSLWSGAAAPPETPGPANPVRSIVTRSGHVMKFDDSDQGGVSVTSNGGHKVMLSDADGKLTVAAKSGNAITLSDDGIELSASRGDLTLSAPSGQVNIQAMTISGKADTTATLESSATLDIKASATLGLRGAIVNIN